ncbi:MAG: DUF4292 domain-containing protein [Prolixibacteraceae bacterium]|nr:DUF4292 domain-containing protein [Prolixibacteraceae bacterium]
MKKVHRNYHIFLFIILTGIAFSSCKTTRIISETNLKPIRTSRLIENINKNALNYEYLTIRKINCQYRDENEKATFRANVKAIKDEAIVVSFNKLNIPFGRVYLTPDSVKFINHMDKTYFLGDYSFLRELFNIDLGFYDVQSILANNVFSYRNSDENDFRNLESYIDSGMYIIQSVNNRKLDKIVSEEKNQKADRLVKRFNDGAFIIQKIAIWPRSFNISEIKIEDSNNRQQVQFNFDDYTKLDQKDYPGEIDMNFISGKGGISMKMKLSGFSTDKINNLNFNIPQRYQQMVLNR